MGYKKDQGRYARMSAFWGLIALVGYGCLSGLPIQLRRWLGESDPYIESFPLLGDVDLAMVLSLAVLGVSAAVIHGLLNKPKAADLLIDTESELRKVTWPSGGETWNGTVAVVVTVIILLFYLFAADAVISQVLTPLMASGTN